MTVTERFEAALETEATFTLSRLTTATALTVMLFAPYRIDPASALQRQTGRTLADGLSGTPDTAASPRNDDAVYERICDALRHLHDELAAEQIDLTPEEKSLIYARLWDLYG